MSAGKLNEIGEMDIIFIIMLLFVVSVGLLLGAAIFGSFSTSVGESITDNETYDNFARVDNMGAQAFNVAGSIALPAILFIGFLIIFGVWKS